jgi:hypothetical protein
MLSKGTIIIFSYYGRISLKGGTRKKRAWKKKEGKIN